MPRLPARLAAWLLSLLLLLGAGFAYSDDLLPVPRLVARVTDLTTTLTSEQRGLLDAKLAAFEREKGAQIVVLIVATVKPQAIEQYALRVVEAWQPGRRGIDDGALLLVAKEDRKLRIEVGYGLEGALNDATAKRIISETISPHFKQGDFFGGIDAGVDAMIRVIGGEPLPAPSAASLPGAAAADSHLETLLFVAFILVFVVGGVLRAIFGRFLAAGIVGVAAGVIAAMLISSVLVAAAVGFAGFIASILFGALGGAGWTSGGISWGGGGGGGGSQGFSGGGGGFGGGGASGDW
ncbi:conserved membrane hypothetical protein [Candidatus Accumulibacter aalborgensis]|uniref:TPM domain-containing protein n=1 Tax=Candidatus Accumulibacter aalborgensis TaxID=1860102 RepID=A0A1A8Y0A2_9PROT|nr:TPM domain-containing protein [Candidatus Accumulibacter aalborgensis]SBT09748.1 conserved membrane hypothetical protein [Candidatus Accumulibacter aalborgensis]